MQLRLRLLDTTSHFPAEWQRKYWIVALEVNDRCRVLDELENWKRKHREDYKKIQKVAKMVADQRPVQNRIHVIEDSAGSGVYEMRAHKGHARLFFMYGPPADGIAEDKDGVVILLYTYWKAKTSPDEQDRAFEKGRQMKQHVEQFLPSIYDSISWEQPVD